MDPLATSLLQWNSAERAPHPFNKSRPRTAARRQYSSAAAEANVSTAGAEHRAIEALMLGVREDDENLPGDWPSPILLSA
jgi:hypothetical protein